MTDEEFDVMDELYFVISFKELLENTGLPDDELIRVLHNLYNQGWVRIMETVDDELTPDQIDLENKASQYFFLATKNGLLAHNS